MVELVCVDGSVLSLLPVPRVDRRGVPYESTLRLLRDGQPFGDVGQCSAWLLARTADALRAEQRAAGRFPVPDWPALLASPDGVSPVLRTALPRDRELLCLRAREPDDGEGTAELRLWVREDRTWQAGHDGARGRWSLRTSVVLDVWGSAGTGLRCLLDGQALLALLDALVQESDGTAAPLQADRGSADHAV